MRDDLPERAENATVDAPGGMPIVRDLGPYRLLRRLGAGAMGTVYLAEEDGETLALKVLHPHLLERRGFFKRFRREARAGRRVQHENVVRTMDSDMMVVDGTAFCFLVMEYVEGRTLRQLLEELRVVPEALVREIGLQIAEGLSAVHAESIVHRDLKPDNVLITRDNRVRIMDLGVAHLQAATSALTAAGQFAGTLLYAAPEQIQGDGAMPSSDLYALGVTLYELCTGINPFRRDEPGAVILAQLETVPARAHTVHPNVTPFLGELIGTLMEKRPSARIESARALADLLRLGERSSWWACRERDMRVAGVARPSIPVRRETRLHGREDDLRVLRECWSAAREHDGRMVLVEGEAGIGKTRLVDAFLAELQTDDAHVLYGSYAPAGGLGALSDAVLGLLGDANLEDSLLPYLGGMSRSAPGFAGHLRHEPSRDAAAELPAGAVHAAFAQLLGALAAEKPVIWIVDDLHFADADSRAVVSSVARAVESRRALVIATTRPGLDEQHLANLSRLGTFRRLTLGRLSPREVVELVREAFRSEALAEKLGVQIAYKSDGVPFFVFEMIRGLRDGQFITQLPDGTYVETRAIDHIQVPSAVKDLVEARVRDVDKHDRELLDLASVVGYEFDPDLLSRALRVRRIEVLKDLANIERRWGVVRSAGLRFRFDHHQIHEVLYDGLPEGLRQEYHALVADVFEARLDQDGTDGRAPTGEEAVFVVSHRLRGSRPERAMPLLDAALTWLENSCRYELAAELTELARVHEDVLPAPELATLLIRLVGTTRRRGDVPKALELLETCERLIGNADTRQCALVHYHRGCALASSGQPDAARESLLQAAVVAEAAGARDIESGARGAIGSWHHDRGEFDDARRWQGQALAIGRETGDVHAQMYATGNLGNVEFSVGRYDAALEHYRQQECMAVSIGDRYSEVTCLGNQASLLIELGRYAEAEQVVERALPIARAHGLMQAVARLHTRLGSLCLSTGRVDESRSHGETAYAIAQELGDDTLRGNAASWLGLVREALGDYEGALRAQREAAALSPTGGLDEAAALIDVGSLLLALGDLDAARAAFEAALSRATEAQAPREKAYATRGLADLAAQQGELSRARELHVRALDARRGLGSIQPITASLLALGSLEERAGNVEDAERYLDEALTHAQASDLHELAALAHGLRSVVRHERATAARAALLARGESFSIAASMQLHFLLWRADHERPDLEEAKRLLDQLVDRAPREHRETMIRNVPVHREITMSWEQDRSR